MTITAPPTTGPQVVGPRPGLVKRARLQQPIRFYLWPALLLALVVELAAAIVTGDSFAEVLLTSVLPLLWCLAAVEAARRSSCTIVEMLQRVLEVRRG